MNKRQLKKRSKKCIPVIADEYNLLTMTEEERIKAIEAYEYFRNKYAYRKRYKDLKGKLLTYYFPTGEQFKNWFAKVSSLCRSPKRDEGIIVVNQDVSELMKAYPVGGN